MQEFFRRHIKGRRFQPSLLPTLAYIVFMLILLSLGNWQVDRASEKSALFSAFSSGTTMAKRLENALEQAQPRYQRVQLQGRFSPQQQYLLDNIVQKGRFGYQVLTPFKTLSGKTLIVNRGWIPLSDRQGPLSEFATLLDVSSEKTILTGRLDKMLRPGLLLAAEIPDTAHPKIVQFPPFEQLSADLDVALVPWQVLLDVVQTDTRVSGYLREWSPHEMGPERHIGYAVQWFALAFTLTIIFIILTFRRVSPSSSEEAIENTASN